MKTPSNAGRAFVGLLALAAASLALLIGLVWWQSPHLSQGVWLACQSAVQAMGSYLPLAGLVLPLALLAAGAMRALTMFASQLWYTRRLLHDLRRRTLPAPGELARLTSRLHLEGRVTLVDDSAAYAFAAGLALPHIWLSSGLLALLNEAELAAVLCHERHHLRRRDPLRVLLVRSMAHGLFFLPAAASLRDLYMDAKEREADAASGAGHDLAAALLKLVRSGAQLPTGASLAAAGSSATTGRIQRLLGAETSSRAVDRAVIQRLAASLALAAALWIASTVSSSQAASPLAGGECGYTTWSAAQERNLTPATFTPYDAAPTR